MKQKVIEDLIKAEIMRMTRVKWIIKELIISQKRGEEGNEFM
jgi:hypothetical protein